MLRFITLVVALGAALLAGGNPSLAADNPKEIRLDYAYYSPPSLVLKRFGWLEEEFKNDGIPVKWVLS